MSCASSVRKYHLTEIHTNCLIFSLPERVEWESYKLSFLFICLNEINDLCACNIPRIAHLAFPSKIHITLTRIIYICLEYHHYRDHRLALVLEFSVLIIQRGTSSTSWTDHTKRDTYLVL